MLPYATRRGACWKQRVVEAWHERSLYMEWGILHTAPGEMSMYAMENIRLPTNHIRRYSLRTDGFVSVNAGYGGGEVTTRPLVFDGSELELNYSTAGAGEIRVEIQDTKGHPIAGYTLEDCDTIKGDAIAGHVKWKDSANVGKLAGQSIHLRFVMNEADLYSLQFTNKN